MQTQISIFAFIAAVVMFIVRYLEASADSEGRIHLKTPRELALELKKRITDYCKMIGKITKK